MQVDLLSGDTVHRRHPPGTMRPQRVLHLHCLQDDKPLLFGHRFAFGDKHLRHRPRQWRPTLAGDTGSLIESVLAPAGKARLALRPVHLDTAR